MARFAIPDPPPTEANMPRHVHAFQGNSECSVHVQGSNEGQDGNFVQIDLKIEPSMAAAFGGTEQRSVTLRLKPEQYERLRNTIIAAGSTEV